MKIRSGFVSNSSSSSFIISNEKFKTVRSLATYMIKQKIKETSRYDDVPNDDIAEYINYDKKYIKNLQKIDKNDSVSFPSCNYDTYIRKVGDCYLVATCNNTDWNLYEHNTNLTEIAKEVLKELKNSYPKGSEDRKEIKDILEGDHDEFSSFGRDYYDLNKEIVGVETYDYCENHGVDDRYNYRLWNTQKYGKICLECSPYLKRKDKLDKLNQISSEE